MISGYFDTAVITACSCALVEQRQIGRPGVVGVTLRGQLLHHRRHARVCVLDVVHGVFVGAGLRQLEVEIERLVVAAQQIEETAGIVAHFVAQIAQRDEVAFALAHRQLLAAAEQAHELHETDLEAVARRAERHQRAAHARDVAVMVRAPDVDQQIVAALPLVEVVGDVGGEIGLLAVGAHHHAVFVVAELRRLEPLGAILRVHAAALAQLVQRLVDGAAAVELALGIPAVEAHAELFEIVADVGHHRVAGEQHDGIELPHHPATGARCR